MSENENKWLSEQQRARIERMDCRAGFGGLQIETAELVDGVRRIKGIANTFGVMRSGRLIHPQAVEDWLAGAGDAVTIPLLAQHGMVPGFATIGKVDVLRVQRSKGLYFEATIAADTDLADEAWTLVSQKLLSNLSIGWSGKQARWVRADDVDIDPWIQKQMKKEGVQECYAFLALELLEISLVDLGDDRGGRLAAGLLPDGPREDYIALLREALREALHPDTGTALLETREIDVAAIQRAAIEESTKAVCRIIEDFARGMENRLIEVIEAAGLVEGRSGILADLGGEAADLAAAEPPADRAPQPDGTQVSALVARVRAIGT